MNSKEYLKEYYKKNREAIIAKQHEYYQKHKADINEKARLKKEREKAYRDSEKALLRDNGEDAGKSSKQIKGRYKKLSVADRKNKLTRKIGDIKITYYQNGTIMFEKVLNKRTRVFMEDRQFMHEKKRLERMIAEHEKYYLCILDEFYIQIFLNSDRNAEKIAEIIELYSDSLEQYRFDR